MSVAVKVTSSGSGLNVRNLQEFQLKKGLQMKKIVSILKAKKKLYIHFQIRPNNAPALLIF